MKLGVKGQKVTSQPPPSPLWYSQCLATKPAPDIILSQDSQVEILEILKIGTPWILAITFCENV